MTPAVVLGAAFMAAAFVVAVLLARACWRVCIAPLVDEAMEGEG